jgi:hypothetical protein
MRDLDSYGRDIKDALLTPRHFPDPAGQFRACPRPTHKGLGGIGKTPLAIELRMASGGSDYANARSQADSESALSNGEADPLAARSRFGAQKRCKTKHNK